MRVEILWRLQRQNWVGGRGTLRAREPALDLSPSAISPALAPHPQNLPSAPGRGTDPSAGDTRSPNTLIACADDTLGWSNATQGSARPLSPSTAMGPAAGGLILHPAQASVCIHVCCTQESQRFFFGITFNSPFLH